MKTKILILVIMFILLIPLYISVGNLTAGENREIKTSSIVVNISTTSDWSRVSFDGASIKNSKILDKTQGLKDPIIDSTGIILNKYSSNNAPDIVRMELELDIFKENVDLVISKDFNGETVINIDKIGEYRNNKKPLSMPVIIETTSDWTKLGFNGATIRNAQTLEIKGNKLREPIIGTNSIILAKLETNDTSYGSSKFLVDLSLDNPMPVVTLEKADNGRTTVTIGESILVNDQTTLLNLKNIPLIIETTSNKTEIDFKGIIIRKVMPLEVDSQEQVGSIVGSDFILLNYSHSGNSYRKASYLVDFGVSDYNASISIMKNDPGYTVVNLATYDFADIGKNNDNKYVTYTIEPENLQSRTGREPLFELDQLTGNNNTERSLPLRIETTSDWTDITFKDITITEAEIKSTTGNIEKPIVGTNTISLKKPKSYDNSFASAELLLQIKLDENFINQHNDMITMTIAKGDIGATTVLFGMDSMANAENIKNDPRNTKTFEIPLNSVQSGKNNGDAAIYNPVTYSVPLFNELKDQDIVLEDTQEMQNSYAILADMFPGENKINFNQRKSEAFGLLGGVILFYLILIILGIHILSKEGFFDFIPGLIGEDKITVRTISAFSIKLFEKTPASSLYLLEALIVLAITPFVLMVDRTYAEGTSILAYFLLVLGVLLRVVGQSERANRIFLWQGFQMVMFLMKTGSIVMILSSLVTAGYELVGLYGAIAFFVPGLLFMILIIRYVKNHFETGSHAAEW
ncbi:Uncharacterised protein [uncultured archaeon]|nr:Uncharacterised protein [uncultured archaeon]